MNKLQRKRDKEIKQIMKSYKFGRPTYAQAKSIWKHTMGPNRYKEIVKLHRFCQKIRVCSVLEVLYDGYAIRFPRGKFGDFVQHAYSYGSCIGCVEPAIGCTDDYTAVPLEDAKELIRRYKDRLNGVQHGRDNQFPA